MQFVPSEHCRKELAGFTALGITLTIDPENQSATNADGTTREFTQQGFGAPERACCATGSTCDCVATTAVPCGAVGTETTNLPKMDDCFKAAEFA